MRKLLGNFGEQLAEQHLIEKGYEILHRNWRYSRLGEIDLIAYLPDHKRLVFVEVKTRGNQKFGHVSESISALKQQKIQQLAEIYIAQAESERAIEQMSFDVVLVETQTQPVITHLESAF